MSIGVLQLTGSLTYNKDTAIFPMGPLTVSPAAGDSALKMTQTIGPTDLQLDLDNVNGRPGIVMFRALELDGPSTAPTAPPITEIDNVGTPGSSLYGYRVVGRFEDGSHTAASDRVDTTTGNATLDNTNNNLVTWTDIGLFDSFDLYRIRAATGIYYVQFEIAFHASEISAGGGAGAVDFVDSVSGLAISVFYNFGSGFWVYGIGGSTDIYTASVTADTFVTVDLKIEYNESGITLTPRFDGTAGTPVTSSSYITPPTELRVGSTNASGTGNNRSFKHVKVGTTDYGTSDLFSAPLSGTIVPQFDSEVDGADLSIVSSAMLADPADGTPSYAKKAITAPLDLSVLIGNFTGSSTNDVGVTGTVAVAPSVGTAPTKPVVKFGRTSGVYTPAMRIGEFATCRWSGSEIHCIAATPILTELVVIEK